jgi:hypothetical protein
MVTQIKRRAGTRKLRPVTSFIVLAAAALVSRPTQAEVRHVKRTSVSNVPTTIGIGARWNKACESIGIPDVRIETPPANGFVCIRRAKVTPRHVIFGGAQHCLGIAMSGIKIVYQSRSGFTGPDTLTYTLKFPRGDQTLAADIRVKPSSRGSGYDNNPLYERQMSGPAPECAALTS